MQVVNILGFIIAMFIISVHFSTKVIDWYERRRYLKYKDSSAEFVADLYKLKIKWTKRGEFLYAKALDTVIGAEMMPDREILPQTQEGKTYIEAMKKLMQDEARELSDVQNY